MKASKTKKRAGKKRAARTTEAKRTVSGSREAVAKPKRNASKSRKAAAVPKRARRAAAAAKRGAPAVAAVGAEIELEAAVLRRLLRHFDEHKDVQNIELMILAGFCRNCLSKWLVEAAGERGVDLDIERAREKVYGMPYSEWKERFQQPATEDQLKRFGEAEQRKQTAGSSGKG